MRTPTVPSINRRVAIGATLAAATAVALPLQTRAKVIFQRGMIGGGLAKFQLSEAQFSVFASRFIFQEEQREVVVGSVLWVDAPSSFTFASTEIADYLVLDDPAITGEARRILGTMSVNGGATYPFSLDVVDAGDPGSGADSVVLTVGDGAIVPEGAPAAEGLGFSYGAAGPITVGDVQDVDFDIDSDEGTESLATPTA
jgi:hypothetical protein